MSPTAHRVSAINLDCNPAFVKVIDARIGVRGATASSACAATVPRAREAYLAMMKSTTVDVNTAATKR